jgi:hypothetical protein
MIESWMAYAINVGLTFDEATRGTDIIMDPDYAGISNRAVELTVRPETPPSGPSGFDGAGNRITRY